MILLAHTQLNIDKPTKAMESLYMHDSTIFVLHVVVWCN